MSTARRVLAILFALAGATGFALSVEGGRWWRIGDDIGIGTISTTRCFGGQCGLGSLAWAGGSGTWERAGFATYVAGLCTAAVLVALAGAIAARRTGRLVSAVAIVAILTAIAAGAVFYLARPELPTATVGRGVVLFAVAIGCAIAAVVTTLGARGGEPA